ncbi:MAG: hypothetical protein J6Z49_08225 [Kiritimatiellae bacterium]|nr:hypothetical protein [Kiritimatiellia bacterium]
MKRTVLQAWRKIIRAVALVVSAGTALVSLAVAAPSFVNDEAVFWLDASTLSLGEINSWADVRGGSYPVASNCRTVNPRVIQISSGDLSGKKTVDFGTYGTDCDMKFPDYYTVKTVFFVVDVEATQGAFLLGGPTINMGFNPSYAFHRGSNGQYKYSNAPACSYWTDGVKVANPGGTVIPTGYHLITYRFDAADGTYKHNNEAVNGAWVQFLASDRDKCNNRIAGKRLCEVIAFTRALDDWERCQVEGYLRQKWYGGSAATLEAAAFEMLWKKAQVRFDASVASSFHYDTEDPTKVVQWDDISGNNNNFTQNTLAKNARLGGLSEIRGKPVYDTEGYSSGIDLVLNTRLTTTRTVFMVCDVIANNNVMWLGDHQMLRFIRGYDNSYFYQYAGEQVYGWSKATIWCNGVQVPTSNQPERAGELSVYVFRVPANCEWEYLGLDRDCDGYARNGGKRVAELITFDFEMPDAALNKITNLLIDKWTPTEEYINSIAPVHVDASSAANFNYTDANITGWQNVGLGADLYYYPQGYLENTPYNMNYGAYGMTNGVPAFLMGAGGSDIDLAFERLTNIRTVFWAMDIDRVQRAFFLGDPRMTAGQGGEYHFHRGGNGQYAAGYDNGFRYGNLACDGTVVNTTGDKPPYGMHVFDLSASKNCTAAAISGDRWCDHRNGGRAISELLILTNEVWGLSRVGVRKRIADKWTKRCGWAGAGDAEWGADKYRVFGADATVPEGGTAAKGIGFTADMTLDGDALAIGTGGFFANEGVTATVEAPVTGDVGVFGAGTVLFASAQTLQSLHVGCNATAELKPGSMITGNLTMLRGAKVEIDVSGLGVKEYAEISIGGTVSLPEGGTFLDYVALSDDSHVLSLSEDGKKILVNDSVPVRAIWKGGVDSTDTANWTCYDDAGDVLNNKLPGRYVTNMVLQANLDLRAWLGAFIAANGTIDLQGNNLFIDNLDGATFSGVLITNSVAATTATLDVTVANGATVSDTTANIGGNVKFVKSGAGTFVASRTQGYTGGTEISGGMLKAGVAGTSNPLGAHGTGLLVGAGAIFEVNAKGGWGGYDLTLAGGKLQNTGGGMNANAGLFTNITFTANSEISMPNYSQWALAGANYDPVTIYLDGNTLKSDIYPVDINLIFCNVSFVGGGYFNVNSGGNFQTGVKGTAAANNEIVATDVDLRMNAAMRLYAPISVRNYEAAYGSLDWVGCDSTENAELKVHGAFKPSSHDCFYGCTMMDGSSFDLSNRTGEGKLPFYLTADMKTESASCAHKSVTFAPGATVTVDLTPFDVKALVNTYVLTWDAKPADSVKFVPDAPTMRRGYGFAKDSGGLRLITSGFSVFVK